MEAFQAKLVQTLVSTQLIKSVGQSFEVWGFFLDVFTVVLVH